MTGVISNSKSIGEFEINLAPGSPYKPLEETFYRVFKQGAFMSLDCVKFVTRRCLVDLVCS